MQEHPSILSLNSGGLITNYYCSSQCRHCLYAAGPSWEKEYITEEMTGRLLDKVLSLGCSSLHIGGGEPLLNSGGLMDVLHICQKKGVYVDYVETNSSWFKGEEEACILLSSLKECGLGTMLISISPFHNEYIPFYKVKGVLKACRKTGMRIFPWVEDFYPDIDAFDDKKTHSLEEYKARFGQDYVEQIPGRYWVTLRGRALFTYAPFMKERPYKEILAGNQSYCSELYDTSHFHVDLFGNYLPGLCSGLSIRIEDLGRQIKHDSYPFLHILMTEGIQGLYRVVSEQFGFLPKPVYVSKCELCYHIRHFLVIEKEIKSKELNPVFYYRLLKIN
jgi:hypothetical protein